MDAAAGQAGLRATERTHSPHFAPALRAMINILPSDPAGCGQRQTMATPFVGQTKITASIAPLGSVWIDHASGIARVGHEMRQFVQKCAGQLLGKSKQPRVEQNHGAVEPRQSCCGAQPRVPVQGDAGSEARQLEARRPNARLAFHAPQHFRRVEGAGLERARRHTLRWSNPRCPSSNLWVPHGPALLRNTQASSAGRCA